MKIFLKNAPLLVLLFFAQNLLCQTSYTPDTSFRNKIRKETWEGLKPKTPQKQQFLLGLVFNSNEPFKSYEKAAKDRGWPPYAIHTAASFFQIVCEEVIRGRDFTEAEYKATYEQLKSSFAAKKVDAKINNQGKQQKYDALIIKAFWAASMFELAKKNSPEIQQLAKDLLQENPAGSGAGRLSKSTATASNGPRAKDSNTASGQKPEAAGKNPSRASTNNTGDLADIIMRTVTLYGLNGVYVKNEVNVLYKNGDVFTNPTAPLESFNIANSKRSEPKKWDRWRRNGNMIHVTKSRNGKSYDWKKWFDLRPGNDNQKLNGKYYTLDPFGGSTVINASTVFFDSNGRFAWKTIKGGDTAWKPIFTESSSAGKYYIDNYTITLNYNNGTKESFFFGFYPKDNQHFIIGANHFVPSKK